MFMFALVLVSYFFVTGGIIYDIIVEPPSVGSTTDEHGHSRPVAFMPYRVNGQYIMEGLASSFLFTMGGLGYVVLDQTHNPRTARLSRILLISVELY
uniref:Oligosaccharyltransferase complex subunit n=1 Tax=Strigamia maritima TaxID=126957 RepID=T1J9P0_STRMM